MEGICHGDNRGPRRYSRNERGCEPAELCLQKRAVAGLGLGAAVCQLPLSNEAPHCLGWGCRLAVLGFLTLKTTSCTLSFWPIFYLLSVASAVSKAPPVLRGFRGAL